MIVTDHQPVASTQHLLPLLEEYRNQRQEHLVVISLDAAWQPISKKLVFLGSATSSICHPREIYAAAIEANAAAIAICHNHPSGRADPTEADIETTERLEAAGEILGIPLVEHLIVAKDGHFSYAEAGLLTSVKRCKTRT